MIGLDLSVPAALDAFIPEVGKAFTSAVMTSAPGKVRAMLITLMGEVTAPEFRGRWVALAAVDPVVEIFIAQASKI